MSELRPIPLSANQPRHFYRGGRNIARFRGVAPPDEYRPEDWVGSATCRFGTEATGAFGTTVLPGGRPLPAAIAADPVGWLGPEHVARWGGTPAVLVKLLDAGQRLPVHCHPSRAFARTHLSSEFGKTEAWLVVDVPDGGGRVYLGFREEVTPERLREWSRTQDQAAMLAATHALTVRPGDAVLVPAGLPHAIDAGVFLVELQEPTDFSVLIEWKDFAPDGEESGHLRLGWETALSCVDRRAWAPEDVAALIHHPMVPAGPVLPPAADAYFRAELVSAERELAASFAVLVVLRGSGLLEHTEAGLLPIAAGETVLVPYGAGPATVHGDVEVLRCLPPSPMTPMTPDGGEL